MKNSEKASSLSIWRFRQSSAKDANRLYEIWLASVAATHHFVSQSDLQEIGFQVRNDYLPDRPLLVAVDSEERLAGFMGMNGQEIEALFIDPAFHRSGLGRAFIAEASIRSPYLEVSVNAQNHRAVAFYEAMGFTTYDLSPVDDDGRPYPILRMRR